MSVADQMGLQDGGQLATRAEQAWPEWSKVQPRLAVVDGVCQLRAWLRVAQAEESDKVLHALATLAAVDGGDDVLAAAVLAWALLPGACTLANRLRTLSPRIDEVVAAQLWLEVRCFPWIRLRKVAANVLMNTRAGVLRDCEARAQAWRQDRTWSNTIAVDPCGPFWGGYAERSGRESTPAEELLDLLDWACSHDVITDADRGLLLCLLEAADRCGSTRLGRRHGGLMANDLSQAVAEQWGISPVTVRRRVRRSLQALSSARKPAETKPRHPEVMSA